MLHCFVFSFRRDEPDEDDGTINDKPSPAPSPSKLRKDKDNYNKAKESPVIQHDHQAHKSPGSPIKKGSPEVTKDQRSNKITPDKESTSPTDSIVSTSVEPSTSTDGPSMEALVSPDVTGMEPVVSPDVTRVEVSLRDCEQQWEQQKRVSIYAMYGVINVQYLLLLQLCVFFFCCIQVLCSRLITTGIELMFHQGLYYKTLFQEFFFFKLNSMLSVIIVDHHHQRPYISFVFVQLSMDQRRRIYEQQTELLAKEAELAVLELHFRKEQEAKLHLQKVHHQNVAG